MSENNGASKFWVTILVGVVCALIGVLGVSVFGGSEKYLTLSQHIEFEKRMIDKIDANQRTIADLKVETKAKLEELNGKIDTVNAKIETALRRTK